MNLNEQETQQVNDNEGYFKYGVTPQFKYFINCDSPIIMLSWGNQGGKGAAVAKSYVMRLYKQLPVKEKNFNCDDKIRIIRCAAPMLPNDSTGGEIKNSQYPELKRRIPRHLIVKDITIRKPVLTVKDPYDGKHWYFEFVSYGQEDSETAGVQRRSLWWDEGGRESFFDEQIPRLFESNGDIVISNTPAPEQDPWMYNKIFERADYVYRSPNVCKAYYKFLNEKHKIITENKQNNSGITVIMSASEDNPVLDEEVIEDKCKSFDDPVMVMARRYGIFKKTEGKIYKSFTYNIHVIDGKKIFPDGIPKDYKYFRALDYHESNPWAISFSAVSPQNELFIWHEMNPSPEKQITSEIVKYIIMESGDNIRYSLNLIDPLAAKKQSNTGFSIVDDLNRLFLMNKKDGYGTGGNWETWDTKAQVGKDRVRERLNNSVECGRPFNNMVKKNGIEVYLPTIWFFSNCYEHTKSFKAWRKKDSKKSSEKDKTEDTIEKYSHFPMAIECLLKRDEAHKPKFLSLLTQRRGTPVYFRGTNEKHRIIKGHSRIKNNLIMNRGVNGK